MSKIREKAQGFTKQFVGEMIGDGLLVQEGKEQERKAEEMESPDSSPRRERPSKRQHS
ncbi:hypothetical protein [Bradyrhizobium sp.]|uniref:hypothetical protein n=1 Tax=Bradyrhizobium sp. TaxID=376 RepID=UPI0040383343